MKTAEERAKEFVKRFHDKICMGHTEEIEKAIVGILKEQDKITRHACADEVENIPTDGDWNIYTFSCKAQRIIINTKVI
jgi:hypothetical protein